MEYLATYNSLSALFHFRIILNLAYGIIRNPVLLYRGNVVLGLLMLDRYADGTLGRNTRL